MNTEYNKAVVRRYFEELWNGWRVELADSMIAKHFTFRGSLGVTVEGLAGFKGYVAQVRAAFPDFHNRIEERFAEGGKVAARLTYSGTHRGEVFGNPPTGRRIKYAGSPTSV